MKTNQIKNLISELTKEIKSFEASGLVGTADKLKKTRKLLYELETESNIQELVLQWSTEKGIFEKGTALTQVLKLREEVFELEKEIEQPEDENAILLEFGDVLFVLTNMARMLGITFEQSLKAAYEKNKNRTGKMIGGTFVKD